RAIEEEMTPLTERQQRAKVVADEIRRLGGTVTNVLPLAAGHNLKFWVSEYEKRRGLQALTDAGYEPRVVGMQPQVCIKTYSMGMVCAYEIPIPADRQVIADDRLPKGEIVDRAEEAKIKREIELMRIAIYGRKGK